MRILQTEEEKESEGAENPPTTMNHDEDATVCNDMQQQLEEFVLQEAVDPPVPPTVLPPCNIGIQAEDDQTVVSEVTMPPLFFGPLYHTPADVDRVEDPNEEDIAKIFRQGQPKKVPPPPAKLPLLTVSEGTNGKATAAAQQGGVKQPPGSAPSKRDKTRSEGGYGKSGLPKKQPQLLQELSLPATVATTMETVKESSPWRQENTKMGNIASQMKRSPIQGQDEKNKEAAQAAIDDASDPIFAPPTLAPTVDHAAILDSISPLPPALERSSANRTPASVPGAHPVAGPGSEASRRSESAGSLLSILGDDTTPMADTSAMPPSADDLSNSNFDATASVSTVFDGFVFDSKELAGGGEETSLPQPSDVESIYSATSIHSAMTDSTRPKEGTSSSRYKKSKAIINLCIILLLLVVVPMLVLFLAILPSRPKTEQEDTPYSTDETRTLHPTVADVNQPSYPPFQDNLPFWVLKALEEGPNTAESRANAWMWNDPRLEHYTEEQQRQRFGLAAFYYSTNGDNWLQNDNWLDYDIPVCQWFFKAAEASHSEPICQDESDAAPTLLTLDLHSNNVSGSLPKSFWVMIKPRYVRLSYNKIEGVIPYFPMNVSFLEIADIHHNRFSGPMTGEAGMNFPNLRIVLTHNNFLSGNSGVAYRVTPKLEVNDFSNNVFTRPQPSDLQFAKDLRFYNNSNNMIHGSLATELGVLSKLEVIDYSGNMLTGTIPESYNNLTSLEYFNIMDTGLTGPLPDLFCERQAKGLLQVLANCTSIHCCTST